MWPPLNPDRETSPDEALGLEQIDLVLYPIRKVLKNAGHKYQFQSPAFGPHTATLVGWNGDGPFPYDKVEEFLGSVGFSGTPLHKMIPLSSSTNRMLEVVVSFLSVEVHGEDRPAIRIAYQLYT